MGHLSYEAPSPPRLGRAWVKINDRKGRRGLLGRPEDPRRDGPAAVARYYGVGYKTTRLNIPQTLPAVGGRYPRPAHLFFILW